MSAINPTTAVIIGRSMAAKVEEDGGNEEARTAMLCGVVILILRCSPRESRTECRFCIALIKALGSSLSSSAVKYSLPTAMATTEVAGMKGATRVVNHVSAAEGAELRLATWEFSTATVRSMPEFEKASRIWGLVS